MHPYIPHLLSDIKAAHRVELPKKEISMSFEEEMAEIERWVSGAGERPLSEFTKLKKENFPPPNQLHDDDMSAVLADFDEMLASWNADIAFPEDMPVARRYQFLIENVLEDEFTPISFGHIALDYCTGNSSDCAWGEYCPCLKHLSDE